MISKIVSTIVISTAVAFGIIPIANADNPTCPSCNQGGGSIGDGFVPKVYRCPNEPGRMLSIYESSRGTPPDLSTLCPEDEVTDDLEIELPDDDN